MNNAATILQSNPKLGIALVNWSHAMGFSGYREVHCLACGYLLRLPLFGELPRECIQCNAPWERRKVITEKTLLDSLHMNLSWTILPNEVP